MTKFCLVLLVLLTTTGQSGAVAASGFESFFSEFRAAIGRNDAKAVADRTKLPFLFDGKQQDHGGFQKIYPKLFDRKVRACFKDARAVTEDDRYVVHCGRYIFYFGLAGGRYRLIEFAADPEADP